MNTFLRIVVIVMVSLVPGCRDEPAPVTAAKAFAASVRRGDVKAMLEHVDLQAVTYLEQAADRASDQIGGRRSLAPREMLQIVDVDRFEIKEAVLVSANDLTAQVKLVATDGAVQVLNLVYENDAWRVQIPVPGVAEQS